MAANDQTYEPDVDEDEDFLQTSNNFRRPVTADTGVEAVNTIIIWRVLEPKRKPSNQNCRNERNHQNDGNRRTRHHIRYSFSRCFCHCFGGYSRFVSMVPF